MKYGDIYSHFLKTWNTSNTSRQLDVGNVLQNNCWHGVSNLIWWNFYVAILPIWDVNGRSLRVFLLNHNSIHEQVTDLRLLSVFFSIRESQKTFANCNARIFGLGRLDSDVTIPNFENTIRNFKLNRVLNRPWLAENWHLYCRQTLKDKKSLMSAIQNIRRNFVLLRFFLLN